MSISMENGILFATWLVFTLGQMCLDELEIVVIRHCGILFVFVFVYANQGPTDHQTNVYQIFFTANIVAIIHVQYFDPFYQTNKRPKTNI